VPISLQIAASCIC